VADHLREIFVLNQTIVLWVSGQAFFVLGLVIASRLLRESHLPLARSLRWLAVFGFLVAFHEWGEVFIPIQAQFIPDSAVELLLMIQSVVLAVAFACLFQFGVTTLDVAPTRHVLVLAPAAALGVWFAWAFGPALAWATDPHDWHRVTVIAARYGLCLPAAMLGAWALRKHAQTLIAPLELPHIWRTLRLSGLALGGLVVPMGSFFPASTINEAAVFRATGIPIDVFRGALGLVLAWSMASALQVFREERDRRLAAVQEQSALATERERFARELHDGTLQTVYAAGLLLRAAERGLADGQALGSVRQSIALLDQAVADLRGTLGELRPTPPRMDVREALSALVDEPYVRGLITVDLSFELDGPCSLSPSAVEHLVAIAREAISNVVRHAHAARVHVGATSSEDRLVLLIEDDGCGIAPGAAAGSGLRNMRDRARLLGGRLDVSGGAGRGTIVSLEIPCSQDADTAVLASPAGIEPEVAQ
jgi:signal transduction histidine kinase